MVGTTISHYHILRTLGAGGMGEVFLAEDTKLGRQVALKILAREKANDPDRRARFEREARAIAALNHPNIVTIHSVEEDQGLLFLTMELVEGRTLSDLIPSAGMPLDQLLKIAIPLADAVGTAHRRGITHRDLKPANVMLSDDGRVKVLDFGLAKQESKEALQTETALEPTVHRTAEGRILGTVAYMSPEQAQGKPVDPRSDIFSLGVVLFEMATGRRPFTGDSNVSVLSSVLKDTPPLVTDLRPELPRELARIVKHCLAKDPEERYQNAKDLRNDLKALKEESDSGELASSASAGATPVSAVSSAGTATSATAVPRPARRWLWAGLAAIVVAVAAGAAWWLSAPRPPRVLSIRQITTDGARKGNVVTDGARLYFQIGHLGDGPGARPALAQVAASGGDTVELAAQSPALLDIDPVAMTLLVDDAPVTAPYGTLAVMPVLGGAERRLGGLRTLNNSGAAAWTPDKSHIVFVTRNEVRVAASDGTGSRTLLTAAGTPDDPRISPDGTRLRYTVYDPAVRHPVLWEAGADGSDPHPLLPGWTAESGACCGRWTPDGRYYVFLGGEGNLWARSEARGPFRRGPDAPTQLTFGPVNFNWVTPSRDGTRLFAVGDQFKAKLARYDPASKQFVEYLGGLSAEGVVTSPDGRWIAYTAFPEGTLWRSRLDGSDRLQLTLPPMIAVLPRWSPDGSELAFFDWTSGKVHVYLVPAAGGAPRRATDGTSTETDSSWSPDGKHLLFGSSSGTGATRVRTIQVVDLTTGHVSMLPGSEGFFSPRWSPDGRSIVALSEDSTRLVIFDVASQTWSDLVPAAPSLAWPSWSADGKAVTFVRGVGEENAILRVRVADRAVETVASARSLQLATGMVGAPWFGTTPDGSPIVLLDAGTHDIYALDWDAP